MRIYKRTNIVGNRYGRLIVTGEAPKQKGRRYAFTRCDCGAEKTVCVSQLLGGRTNSCGCLSREMAHTRAMTHGYAPDGPKSPEYTSWASMRSRCNNPHNKRFAIYGGRGIMVCERWDKDFVAFLADMGERPTPNHSLDRIDVNGNYEPENCRWATRLEQAHNMRKNVVLSAFGRTMVLAAWAKESGVPNTTLWRRVKQGFSPEDAMTLTTAQITALRRAMRCHEDATSAA